MTEQEIDYSKISTMDFFSLSCALIVEHADVSDFGEDEIRNLCPINPFHPRDVNTWDGKLLKKEPVSSDLGMDKHRKIYWFNKEWKPITN